MGEAGACDEGSKGSGMVTAISYWDGEWRDAATPLIGPHDHAFFMASVVFDGARAFGGHTPDLDRHCARVVESARGLLLEPQFSAEQITALCREGVAQFPKDAELYIRPMFYAMRGFVLPEAGSTRFVLAINEMRMPVPGEFAVCFSSFAGRPGTPHPRIARPPVSTRTCSGRWPRRRAGGSRTPSPVTPTAMWPNSPRRISGSPRMGSP
jgi:hypothetical protein